MGAFIRAHTNLGGGRLEGHLAYFAVPVFLSPAWLPRYYWKEIWWLYKQDMVIVIRAKKGGKPIRRRQDIITE